MALKKCVSAFWNKDKGIDVLLSEMYSEGFCRNSNSPKTKTHLLEFFWIKDTGHYW